MNIREILGDPGRSWSHENGASEADIERLLSASPVPLPDELAELLRHSDGGEGDLALPPLVFVLDPVEEIVRGLEDPSLRRDYAGFVFFGGNGGLERIALDVRGGAPPWPVVMVDPVAGPESAAEIAPDMASFVQAIGLEAAEEESA